MKKYGLFEISTKKKKICDTKSINMWTELTKPFVSLIFRVSGHNEVITVLYWTYEFRFEVRVSNLVCMLIMLSIG